MSWVTTESGQPAGGAASSGPTMLKALLREKHLQNYGLFKRAYEKAAKELDRSFTGTYPSEKTFRRWMSDRVKDLPRAEYCVVLEAMLPGWSAADLLKPYVAPRRRGRLDAIEGAATSSSPANLSRLLQGI